MFLAALASAALLAGSLSCRRSAGGPGGGPAASTSAASSVALSTSRRAANRAAQPPAAPSADVSSGAGPSGEAPAKPGDRAPPKYVTMTVAGVAATAHGSVVLLVDGKKKQAVPIFIGDAEALSIRLRLEHRKFERPLTHDLLDAALVRLGGKVRDVRIEQLESQTFFATVVLVRGAERFELDARSSDAIALALGNDAPIHVAEGVMDDAGVDLDRIHQMLQPGEEPLELPADSDAGGPVAL